MPRKLSSALEDFVRKGRIVFDPNLPDLSKDPTVIQKAKEMQEWLLKVGLPDFDKLSSRNK